jgi:hypothetical protein
MLVDGDDMYDRMGVSNTKGMNMNRYYVKGTRSSKITKAKIGKDMEGFYTYPRIGFFVNQDDAVNAMNRLQSEFPKELFFTEMVPHNFDGVSISGL